jgi:hypothetical protein
MSARKAAKGGALMEALKACQKITKSLMGRQDSGSCCAQCFGRCL